MRLLMRLLVCLFAVLAAAAPGMADEKDNAEARAQARFVYTCAMFIEWPTGNEGDELVIGVVNAELLAGAMAALQGHTVNGRVLRVKTMRPGDDLTGAQVLYVGSRNPDDVRAVLARVGHAPVLTISEHRNFTRAGGMVRLFSERDRLRFEINNTRAEQAGLRVSAKMLGLARNVR